MSSQAQPKKRSQENRIRGPSTRVTMNWHRFAERGTRYKRRSSFERRSRDARCREKAEMHLARARQAESRDDGRMADYHYSRAGSLLMGDRQLEVA